MLKFYLSIRRKKGKQRRKGNTHIISKNRKYGKDNLLKNTTALRQPASSDPSWRKRGRKMLPRIIDSCHIDGKATANNSCNTLTLSILCLLFKLCSNCSPSILYPEGKQTGNQKRFEIIENIVSFGSSSFEMIFVQILEHTISH